MDYRVTQQARSSSSRLLAVAGEKEQALILRSLPELAAPFPRGQHRIVPAVGHAWNGEAPELFARVVTTHIGGKPLPDELVQPALSRNP
jgi:hypothetical protein